MSLASRRARWCLVLAAPVAGAGWAGPCIAQAATSPTAPPQHVPGASARTTSWAAGARERIEAAREALARLDRGYALQVARDVRGEIVSQGGGKEGPWPIVEWAVLESRLARAAGDDRAARAWLRSAAAFGPHVELEPTRHPDEDRDAFARAAAGARAATAARVTFHVAPPGGAVWIDGVQVCPAAPCTANVVPGRHFARVESRTGAFEPVELIARPGQRMTRRVRWAGESAVPVTASERQSSAADPRVRPMPPASSTSKRAVRSGGPDPLLLAGAGAAILLIVGGVLLASAGSETRNTGTLTVNTP